jgi:S1-C subfamily serine protease
VVVVVLYILLGTAPASALTAHNAYVAQRIAEWRDTAESTTAATNENEQGGRTACGWIGVEVRPMTKLFAASLGMAVPHGAIFEQPEPGSPAAKAGIQKNDVITTINGSSLMRSSDFLPIISRKAPGTTISLTTRRNGQLIRVRVRLGSKCPRFEPSAAAL